MDQENVDDRSEEISFALVVEMRQGKGYKKTVLVFNPTSFASRPCSPSL